jgi:hypothetical protein
MHADFSQIGGPNLQARQQARLSEAPAGVASAGPVQAASGTGPRARIFAACHGTQLLVIQHLRHHLPLPPAEEFLLWYPMENIRFIDSFMQEVISSAGFSGTLDIRDFQSLRPRSQGALTWWLESARRLRRDAAALRSWLKKSGISEQDVELWADDPIHVYVNLSRGVLRKSRQVKFPHCFNLEDATIPEWKARIEQQWRNSSWPKQHLFLPWQRLTSGVDLRMERVAYDRAYTFDQPSPWSRHSLDVSHLISIEAFDATYRTLPRSTRADVETILGPIREGRRPLVLLLLFGLSPELRRAYQESVARMFSERASELEGCSFAVKVHPGTNGVEEQTFVAWLKANVPAQVFPIIHQLNLEFMLPQLRPDFVLAGPCGALPIIKRLGVGRPIALSEVTEEMCRMLPAERSVYLSLVETMEVW